MGGGENRSRELSEIHIVKKALPDYERICVCVLNSSTEVCARIHCSVEVLAAKSRLLQTASRDFKARELYVAHKEPSEIVFVLELMHGSCAWDAQFKAQTLRIACAMGFTALCEEMTASALQCLEDVHNVDAELFWEIMLCSRSNLLPSDIYERRVVECVARNQILLAHPMALEVLSKEQLYHIALVFSEQPRTVQEPLHKVKAAVSFLLSELQTTVRHLMRGLSHIAND